ncbi:hypothetical protein ACERK3_09355 [Phycisphaerales bacterium AB-hyl4]|uniref:Uncharacterized protein n=1 Tax=Natronomicrosphaera hydrolytica TaxID=3242702 RepID=A0ABV4U4H7_9BACT
MPKYQVHGARRSNGDEVEYVVELPSREAVELDASNRGLLVSSIEQLPEVAQATPEYNNIKWAMSALYAAGVISGLAAIASFVQAWEASTSTDPSPLSHVVVNAAIGRGVGMLIAAILLASFGVLLGAVRDIARNSWN